MNTLAEKGLESRCLLILGMHRSGTSAATRCLNLVGMDVGSHLLTPDEVNSKGYWEHADAVRINDALLAAFDQSWWSLDPLPEDWLASEAACQARREIERFVRRDFAKVPLWGLKDPRMCRLAPLWIDVLAGMGVSVSAVFTMRPPREVARSLARAHGLAEGAGILSWIQHLAEAEQATRGLPRSMINYDQLLVDPVAALECIGRDLALAWPVSPGGRKPALDAFVDAGMRTHRDLPETDALPVMAHRMAACCREIAAREHSRSDWSALSLLADQAIDFLHLLDYRAQVRLPDEIDEANAARRLQAEPMFASLYHAAEGEGFSEERVVHQLVPPGRTLVEMELHAGPARFRLDPISHPGYYVFHALVLLDAERHVVWDWATAPDQVIVTGMHEVASQSEPGSLLHHVDQDPQMVFCWPEATLRQGRILELDIERLDTDRIALELDALRDASAASELRSKDELDALRDASAASELRLKDELEARDRKLQVQKSRLAHYESETRQKLDGLVGSVELLRQAQARQEAALRIHMRQGLASRLRRRFSRTEFRLVPGQHLEAIDPANGRWRVTGNDPMFGCASDKFPLAPGWYMLSLEMTQHEGPPAQACLYPDYGPDVPPDFRGIAMPFVGSDQALHRGIVRFTHPLHGLRFDPATSACELTLGRLAMRRVSKLRAGLHLLQAARAASGRPGRETFDWRSLMNRLRTKGLRDTAEGLYTAYSTPETSVNSYDIWLESYDRITPRDVVAARSQSSQWEYQPLISVLVPTYNTEEKWLRRCIESVQAQAYPRWELCVADDASPMPHVMRLLNEYAESDERIRVVQRSENGHISASSNTALALAGGEYVALLDHDDELHPLALYEVVNALQAHRSWKLIYTDEDKIDQDGQRYDPYMKPDWNYDLLLAQNCISHLGVYQRKLLCDVGGFREGFEGSQDWDLVLRCVERLTPEEIGHVPRVLYHWRAIPGSTSVGVDEKSYSRGAARKAIAEHLERTRANASVEEADGRPGNFRISYALPVEPPKISLIIPTRDGLHLLRRCVHSILDLTTYDNYEIVIVDNQSCEEDTLQYLRDVASDPRVRVIAYDRPFNYSAINNHAVRQTRSDVVGLINNDIEVISPDWLEEMASHAMRPEIGAVGAMLYYPDDTIQHAGVVLGVHGVAAHSYCGEPRGFAGQMGRARLVQSMSAVTAACLLVRREVFDEVGGLDESLRVAFNDVDFCLRVRRAGYRNLWTPYAELYHHESATRGPEDSPEKMERFAGEVNYVRAAWKEELASDPAYSPNLSITDTPFALAFPPRGPHGPGFVPAQGNQP